MSLHWINAAALCLGLLNGHCATVSLDWFRNPEPDVAEYRIYYGSVSGAYTDCASAGSRTNITIGGLASGATYFFAATAINVAGLESKPSIEISYRTPDAPPAPPATVWQLRATPVPDPAITNTVTVSACSEVAGGWLPLLVGEFVWSQSNLFLRMEIKPNERR